MAEPWCGDPDCWHEFSHVHLSAMQRLDFDDKVCGCKQIGCCEVKRAAT